MKPELPGFGTVETARLTLRPLRVEDVTQTYLGWFATPGAIHISAGSNQTLETLRAYVAEKSAKPDALFLGIFDTVTGTHIGNIKYEPIDFETGEAVMGIFIGAPEWQGRGSGPEVIRASAEWLNTAWRISRILLGVAVDNRRAVHAYTKIGFHRTTSLMIPESPGIEVMALDINPNDSS